MRAAHPRILVGLWLDRSGPVLRAIGISDHGNPVGHAFGKQLLLGILRAQRSENLPAVLPELASDLFVVAPDGSPRLHRLAHLIYAQNWMKVYVSMAGHYWSLAVEEQFYLLWPLVVHRFKPRRVLWISAAGGRRHSVEVRAARRASRHLL